MRLLVVAFSPPDNSFSWPPLRRIAPQPPGPGFPEQAPSVKMSTAVAASSSVLRAACVTLLWKRSFLEYSRGSLGRTSAFGIGIQPVIGARQQKTQRRAAHQDGQGCDLVFAAAAAAAR